MLLALFWKEISMQRWTDNGAALEKLFSGGVRGSGRLGLPPLRESGEDHGIFKLSKWKNKLNNRFYLLLFGIKNFVHERVIRSRDHYFTIVMMVSPPRLSITRAAPGTAKIIAKSVPGCVFVRKNKQCGIYEGTTPIWQPINNTNRANVVISAFASPQLKHNKS
jgi:hypothetical protein